MPWATLTPRPAWSSGASHPKSARGLFSSAHGSRPALAALQRPGRPLAGAFPVQRGIQAQPGTACGNWYCRAAPRESFELPSRRPQPPSAAPRKSQGLDLRWGWVGGSVSVP